MTTTQIFRSQVRDNVAVSTILVSGKGVGRYYETSISINGRVTDGARCNTKGDAVVKHDSACDFVCGRMDPQSKSALFWTAAVSDVVA